VKKIRPSKNKEQWPRQKVATVDCRARDLIVRITDWMDDEDEPAFDVEVYVGGVYDWNLSTSFTLSSGLTKKQCRASAVDFAARQIAQLL
jgi:hypothetical protein